MIVPDWVPHAFEFNKSCTSSFTQIWPKVYVVKDEIHVSRSGKIPKNDSDKFFQKFMKFSNVIHDVKKFI